MVLARGWTGFEATALQAATRMSVREFAEVVSVEPRTVANWRKRGRAAVPRPFTQGLLDTVLSRVDDQVRARFEQLIEHGDAASGRMARPEPAWVAAVPWGRESAQIDAELRVWIEMNRRQLIRLFTGVGVLPAVAAIFADLDEVERDRITDILVDPSRVDDAAVDNIERALGVLLAQNDVFGPEAVLAMVQGQRTLAEALVRECPERLRPRMHNLHGALAQLAGWMQFDLHDLDGAYESYKQARRSAHEARNSDLAALVLCNMAYLEVWRNEPRLGIDHAVAAQNWARRSDDHRLRAYADDMAAIAFAKDNQRSQCISALIDADSAIAVAERQPAEGSVAYFQSPGLVASLRSDCLHQLGSGHDARVAAEEALAHIDVSFVRNRALACVDLANAHADLGEVEAAVGAIRASADLARSCRSDRLSARIGEARHELARWSNVSCVRELDDELMSYGFAAPGRSAT